MNRLTRELSALRQQTQSVASTASSTSTNDYSGVNVVPIEARRHRSSSSLSTRSMTANTGTTSITGVAPARETSVPGSARPSMDIARPSLSRENSHRRLSPALQSSQFGLAPGGGFDGRQSFTDSLRQTPAQTSRQAADHTMHQRSTSFSTAVAAARYEEAAFHRAELESVKKENEALKQRIRELERSLSRQPSQTPAEAEAPR